MVTNVLIILSLKYCTTKDVAFNCVALDPLGLREHTGDVDDVVIYLPIGQ